MSENKKGPESRSKKATTPPLNENEQSEQALMENEEELKKEFERDCAKEWNKRRLERVYASVDGEGFGRDGIYRVDRFGCMEMYVGEFDESPPREPTITEHWDYYVGGEEPPAELLKQERLDKEHMRIGRHEHMKQLEDTKKNLEHVMLESSGPTLRMMRKGKQSNDTNKNSKKEPFCF